MEVSLIRISFRNIITKVHQHYVVQRLRVILRHSQQLLLHFLHSYLSVLRLLTRVSCGLQAGEIGLREGECVSCDTILSVLGMYFKWMR